MKKIFLICIVCLAGYIQGYGQVYTETRKTEMPEYDIFSRERSPVTTFSGHAAASDFSLTMTFSGNILTLDSEFTDNPASLAGIISIDLDTGELTVDYFSGGPVSRFTPEDDPAFASVLSVAVARLERGADIAAPQLDEGRESVFESGIRAITGLADRYGVVVSDADYRGSCLSFFR